MSNTVFSDMFMGFLLACGLSDKTCLFLCVLGTTWEDRGELHLICGRGLGSMLPPFEIIFRPATRTGLAAILVACSAIANCTVARPTAQLTSGARMSGAAVNFAWVAVRLSIKVPSTCVWHDA